MLVLFSPAADQHRQREGSRENGTQKDTLQEPNKVQAGLERDGCLDTLLHDGAVAQGNDVAKRREEGELSLLVLNGLLEAFRGAL